MSALLPALALALAASPPAPARLVFRDRSGVEIVRVAQDGVFCLVGDKMVDDSDPRFAHCMTERLMSIGEALAEQLNALKPALGARPTQGVR